jgi:hypothetical protein
VPLPREVVWQNIWPERALLLGGVFALVFALNFTAPFRLVTTPEIACFIGFLGIGPLF